MARTQGLVEEEERISKEAEQQMMEMFRTIYCSKTKLQRKKLEKTLKKEVTMTAAQCMEFGIIQEFYKANSIHA